MDHRNRLRKEMVEVVLGTDMSSHFGSVASFKTLVEKLGSDAAEWHHEPKAVCLGVLRAFEGHVVLRSALRVMVLHAMDISNPAKVLSLSDKWSATASAARLVWHRLRIFCGRNSSCAATRRWNAKLKTSLSQCLESAGAPAGLAHLAPM